MKLLRIVEKSLQIIHHVPKDKKFQTTPTLEEQLRDILIDPEIEEITLGDLKTDEEVRLLCLIIRQLLNLKKFQLYYSEINDNHVLSLFEVLPLTLQEFSFFNLTTSSIDYIFKRLNRFKCLKEINFFNNNTEAFNNIDPNIIDFNMTLTRVHLIYDIYIVPRFRNVQVFLRTNLKTGVRDGPGIVLIENYRLKLRKFIWLVAKKKIDEFLLIELFHKLK